VRRRALARPPRHRHPRLDIRHFAIDALVIEPDKRIDLRFILSALFWSNHVHIV
jgi:hypothetical protein